MSAERFKKILFFLNFQAKGNVISQTIAIFFVSRVGNSFINGTLSLEYLLITY